jgi:hypothetical protein
MADRSLIDSYLDELAAALGPTRSAANRLITETRDHLLSAAEAAVGGGASTPAAERAAVERFGSPRLVADGWLGERRLAAVGQMAFAGYLCTALMASFFLAAEMAARAADLRGVVAPFEDHSMLLMAFGYLGILPAVALSLMRRRGRGIPNWAFGLAVVTAFFGACFATADTTVHAFELASLSGSRASTAGIATLACCAAEWLAALGLVGAAAWGVDWAWKTRRVA